MQQAKKLIRSNKPSFGDPVNLRLKEPKLSILDNGIEAYCIDAGEEEVCRLDIIVKAGSAYQDKKLVATSTGKLLKEGTKKLSSAAIAEKFDSKGAYLDIGVTKDSANVTLYSLNKHLTELLPLIGELLSTAVFPEDELNIHVERQRQEFLTNNEKVRYKAMLEFNSMVFGTNAAYGQQVNLEDFGKLRRENVIDFYQSRYIPENTYIILSGNLDKEILSLTNKYIGNGWGHNQVESPLPVFANKMAPENKVITKKGALQSAIRVGRAIIAKTHPDYNAFVLLNTILGGYFGSRLMSNLREDKGYTYGVSSFIANFVNASYFSISTEVNADHTASALSEIQNELELLTKEKVGNKELQLVKNYIYGTFLRNFDGPFALAERYRSVRDFGLNFAFYSSSLNEMLQINADTLIETARKYLDQDDMIQLVVGNMK